MRVALTHDALLTQRLGGVSRYVVELHRALQQTGTDSTILAPVTFNDFLRGVPNVRGVTLAGRWHPRGAPRLLGPANQLAERTLLRSLKPDVVHVTYYRRNDTVLQPTVVTVYDMIHEQFPACFPAHDRTAVAKRCAVMAAKVVIAISNATRADLIEILEVDPARVVVTPLASRIREADLEASAAHQRPYLLHVGGRHAYKNGARMFAAFAASGLPGELDLVCFGPALSVGERAQVESLGISSAVVAVSGGDALLANLYRHARAVVVPSEAEGFGLPVLEAMEMDTPVACAAVPSLLEVAGDAAVTFDPTDVDGVAAAMREVVTDDVLRAHLVERGARRRGEFSWERTARLTAAAYERAVDLAGAQRGSRR